MSHVSSWFNNSYDQSKRKMLFLKSQNPEWLRLLYFTLKRITAILNSKITSASQNSTQNVDTRTRTKMQRTAEVSEYTLQ